MKPSAQLPYSTPAIPAASVAAGQVVGMECEGRVEAAYIGHVTEDGRAFYHWQSGPQARDDGIIALAEVTLFELSAPVKAAAARYRRATAKALANRPGPVPPTPKGMGHSAWLALCNCD